MAFGKFLGVLVPQLGAPAIRSSNCCTDPASCGGVDLNLRLPLPWLAEPILLFKRTRVHDHGGQLVGVAIILFLTWWNSRGLTEGKWLQNVFTVAKIGGLIAVVVVGLTVTANAEIWQANFAEPWSADRRNGPVSRDGRPDRCRSAVWPSRSWSWAGRWSARCSRPTPGTTSPSPPARSATRTATCR